jgi:hypothetical protein
LQVLIFSAKETNNIMIVMDKKLLIKSNLLSSPQNIALYIDHITTTMETNILLESQYLMDLALY